MKYDFDLTLDTRNALSLIIKQIHPNSTILEFGPANGRMTRYLKEKLNCSVYIVEIDGEAARDSLLYAVDGIIGDLEEYEWVTRWEHISFDYILFADVLEHLRDPQKTLGQTKLLLKDEGKVILSVPNVGHNAILINLFNNIFNYTPVGLLDNTHIHLFAYNTLVEFCHYAGYHPIIEDAVYANTEETEISNNYDNVDRCTAKALKNKKYGSVYQFVFTLQKEDYIAVHPHMTEYRIRAHIPTSILKVYLDYGDGWNEDNCITWASSSYFETKQIFELNDSENITALRIDPLDVNGLFLIKELKIEKGAETHVYELKDCLCNGIVFDQYLLCKTNDPQIILPSVNLKGPAKLTVHIEHCCVDMDESVVQLLDIIEHCLLGSLRTQLQEALKAQRDMEDTLKKYFRELEHLTQEIRKKDQESEEQKNEIKLLNEELQRRAVELEHRMGEINIRDKKLDRQQNRIRVSEEELERRAVELEHRMVEINSRDEEIARQKNEIKLLNEKLQRRDDELEHHMIEINNRDEKIHQLDELVDNLKSEIETKKRSFIFQRNLSNNSKYR